jgi:cardiolipin synthase A/B
MRFTESCVMQIVQTDPERLLNRTHTRRGATSKCEHLAPERRFRTRVLLPSGPMHGDTMDASDQILDQDEALQRHAATHLPVSDCPLLGGAEVTLLPGGGETLEAVFAAIEAARHQLQMEYYTFEDVHWRGRSLVDLLVEKLRQGVLVALSFDGAGSDGTDDAVFDRLRQAGGMLMEFCPLSPLRRRFNPLKLNDRDHRKLLVVDGQVAFVGGVNMSRVYENPRSAGAAADTAKAFWYDAAMRIEGPPVAEVQKLFLHNWRRQGGDGMPQRTGPATPPEVGNQVVRADGSAPRERRQLYFESLKAAVAAARSQVLLATGYFVPTHRQWQLLAEAAERGVAVDLLLAGHSDLPSCTHAARALYGRLLKHGVRIHELKDGVLHAKVATIDGVWTAIGSSNLDRRSFIYNNEVDAIVLGRATADAVETMLRDWMSRAEPITLAGWRSRSLHERAGERLARLWSRYM